MGKKTFASTVRVSLYNIYNKDYGTEICLDLPFLMNAAWTLLFNDDRLIRISDATGFSSETTSIAGACGCPGAVPLRHHARPFKRVIGRAHPPTTAFHGFVAVEDLL
jgi:hypothetical protein